MPMNDDEVVLTMLRTASEIEAERLANKALKEPNPNIGTNCILLACVIAAAIGEQIGSDELDNLGDGESLVFMGKCPTLNIVQLAEAIEKHHAAERASLERRIAELKDQLEEARYEAMGDDL